MRAPVETWLPSFAASPSSSKLTTCPVPHHQADAVVQVGPAPHGFHGHDHSHEDEDEDEEDDIVHRRSRRSRGSRDEHVKVTRLSSEPHSALPPSTSTRLSSSDRATHHHLPSPATDGSSLIPDNPILYLPPLLSPLPTTLAKARRRVGPTAEELENFNTRLPDIDPASLDLHEALHHFHPVDSSYAAKPYDEAFNWDSLRLPAHTSREWYCVVFRSRRNAASSSLSLYQADREAHEEAVMNGGLVMYWYGVPDETGLNLATCIWQSRRHAVKAIGGPKHMTAMKQAKDAYEVYDLERWVLRKTEGLEGVSLKRYQGGEVGW